MPDEGEVETEESLLDDENIVPNTVEYDENGNEIDPNDNQGEVVEPQVVDRVEVPVDSGNAEPVEPTESTTAEHSKEEVSGEVQPAETPSTEIVYEEQPATVANIEVVPSSTFNADVPSENISSLDVISDEEAHFEAVPSVSSSSEAILEEETTEWSLPTAVPLNEEQPEGHASHNIAPSVEISGDDVPSQETTATEEAIPKDDEINVAEIHTEESLPDSNIVDTEQENVSTIDLATSTLTHITEAIVNAFVPNAIASEQAPNALPVVSETTEAVAAVPTEQPVNREDETSTAAQQQPEYVSSTETEAPIKETTTEEATQPPAPSVLDEILDAVEDDEGQTGQTQAVLFYDEVEEDEPSSVEANSEGQSETSTEVPAVDMPEDVSEVEPVYEPQPIEESVENDSITIDAIDEDVTDTVEETGPAERITESSAADDAVATSTETESKPQENPATTTESAAPNTTEATAITADEKVAVPAEDEAPAQIGNGESESEMPESATEIPSTLAPATEQQTTEQQTTDKIISTELKTEAPAVIIDESASVVQIIPPVPMVASQVQEEVPPFVAGASEIHPIILQQPIAMQLVQTTTTPEPEQPTTIYDFITKGSSAPEEAPLPNVDSNIVFVSNNRSTLKHQGENFTKQRVKEKKIWSAIIRFPQRFALVSI